MKHRLPSMHEGGRYVDAGGLMSYSSSEIEGFRPLFTWIKSLKALIPRTWRLNGRRSSSW